ncbi:MAG: hypothetical protein AABN95_02380 [Acidobacteriota bacterium]
MDIGTGLALFGSAKLVERLLGPTADYIGEGVKHWTARRVSNVDRIFHKAAKKLGSRIEDDGAVPPRVLRGVLDHGSFCDDELSAEYFGGVLASSRSGILRDDRGASYVALLGRLSTYQIRAHYCFYHLFKRIFDGCLVEDLTIGMKSGRESLEILIPLLDYHKFMGFSYDEEQMDMIPHIISGLVKELLIAERFDTGAGLLLGERVLDSISIDGREELLDVINNPEIGVQPTVAGIELFLWAHGKPNIHPLSFFDRANQFELSAEVTVPEGTRTVRPRPPEIKIPQRNVRSHS